MSFTLAGSAIRRPNNMSEGNSTQYAANRTLSGSNTRDYFGSNKRVWTLSYENINATDFATILAIYQAFLANETAVSWAVTETNYTVTSTTVLVDLVERGFTVPGSSYLSNFDLILTET